MHTPSVLDRVLELEWSMFSAVQNVGGQASCQTDRKSFEVMRTSQARSLSHEVLESWLADLEEARRAGRNLMAEKYAWMMQSTAPAEFASLAPQLPVLDAESLSAVEEITARHVAWKADVEARYPLLSGRGRPLRTQEDNSWSTSFETYLRGELHTCSPRTLRLWRDLLRAQAAQGINVAERILLYQVQGHGYHDLATAERSLKQSL